MHPAAHLSPARHRVGFTGRVAAGAYNSGAKRPPPFGVTIFGGLVATSRGSAFVHGMRVSLAIGIGAILVAVGLAPLGDRKPAA